MLVTTDYVGNGNDSYWLSNPNQPLTGFPPLFGWLGPRDLLRGEAAVLHRKPGGLPWQHVRAGSVSVTWGTAAISP